MHRSPLFLLTVIFLLVTGWISCASNSVIFDGTAPRFELIDRSAGLNNLSVSAVAQDQYGFIWFGTQGGFYRYDGRNMLVFRRDPFSENSLINDIVQTMYYDQKAHQLWIGTYEGLSCYDIYTGKFTNYQAGPSGLSDGVVVSIAMDRDGNIWAGTLQGLNQISPSSGTVQQYSVPGDVVRSLLLDSLRRLWIGSYEGLFYFDHKTDSLIKYPLTLPSPFIMSMREFDDNQLYLALWNGGVSKLDLVNGHTRHIPTDNHRAYALAKTEDDTLWVGTWGSGLIAITTNGEKFHFPGGNDQDSLAHPVVHSLLQDSSDILWIGTNGAGVHKLSPRKRNYQRFIHDPKDPASLSQGKINAIFRDSRGYLWIAFNNNGLDRYDEQEDMMIHYRLDPRDAYSLPTNMVNTILETSDGQLLIGTNEGIVQYDYEADNFHPWEIVLREEMVYALAERDREIWIGTYSSGAYQYNRLTGELTQHIHSPHNPQSISDNLVYAILSDSQGRIWTGTNNGLNLYDPNSRVFQRYQPVSGARDQLGSGIIQSLLEDSEGHIWVGTFGGGLAQFLEQYDSFRNYLEADGMSSNFITGLLEDGEGKIWAATQNGISAVDPGLGVTTVLTEFDGLGGWVFNNGHFRDNDSTLLFGGEHGITAIPGTTDRSALKPPKVYITNVELFQEPLEEARHFYNGSSLTFDSNQNFIGFEFAALDFDSPEKIKFSYMLEGYDPEWIYANNRSYASYAHLDPGHYQFLVHASTAAGVWSIEPAIVTIRILAPWYQEPWAYVMYLSLAIGALFGAWRLRRTYVMSKQTEELACANATLEQVNQELERLSVRDPLTGLFNRRYFDSTFAEQLKLAKRSHTPLSLLMLDLDQFKNFNDSFGHVAGDMLLIEVAKAIQGVLNRTTDFVARLGGDEFTVVLFNTDKQGAELLGERMLKAVCNVQVKPVIGADCGGVTMSIGIASAIPEDFHTAEAFISSADQALYKAKSLGRNQTYLAEHIPC